MWSLLRSHSCPRGLCGTQQGPAPGYQCWQCCRPRADLQESTGAEIINLPITSREWNLGWPEGRGNVLQVSSIIYPSRYFLALRVPYYLSLAWLINTFLLKHSPQEETVMGGASGAVFRFVSEKCPPPQEGAQKCISEPEISLCLPILAFLAMNSQV